LEYIFIHSDKIMAVFLLVLMSICIRFFLQFFGQIWISTTAHTATLVLLPIITFVITSVISGNIALSLGMVGALSIVRFRNPVRSPLELSIYFIAITMGIAASVNLLWLLFLYGSLIFVILSLCLTNFLSSKLTNKPFFVTSFSEGNALSSLEVNAKNNISVLDDSELLNLKKVYNGNVQYILVSQNFNVLKDIQKKIETNNNVVDYQINR